MAVLETGDNYSVELDGHVARCRVWSRPDLDFEAGARLAAKKVAICRSLAAGTEARGMLFDLRDAPKVTGPKTQQSLGLIIGVWESAGRPIAILVSPASLQKLQLTRIARDAAPRQAEVFVELEAAEAWLERRFRESRAQEAPGSSRTSSARRAAVRRPSLAAPKPGAPAQSLSDFPKRRS
jgi:hypothetical protein